MIGARNYILGLASSAVIIYPILHQAQYPIWSNSKPRPEKTVVVTGSTENLGTAIAASYAIRKCRVIMAADDMDECRALRRELVVRTKNKSLVCRHLNLEDIDSINKFVDEVVETEPHIDVLVNSSYIRDTSGEKMTKYGIERHFFHNFLGPYLLTLRLLPKLEQTASHQTDARIINSVGSPRRKWPLDLSDINFERRKYTSKRAYRQSKLAFAHFTLQLDKRLREQNSRILVFGHGFNDEREQIPALQCEPDSTVLKKLKTYYQYDPFYLGSTAVRNGLWEIYGLKESGRLYNYVQLSFGTYNGWGPLAKDEGLSRTVWNHAAKLLAYASDLNPEKVRSERGDSGTKSESSDTINKNVQSK